MTKHKALTSKCGITIPKDLRHEAGFMPGQAVDLVKTKEGVLISKHNPTCNICGSPEDVIIIEGFDICRSCAEKVLEEAEKTHGA